MIYVKNLSTNYIMGLQSSVNVGDIDDMKQSVADAMKDMAITAIDKYTAIDNYFSAEKFLTDKGETAIVNIIKTKCVQAIKQGYLSSKGNPMDLTPYFEDILTYLKGEGYSFDK